MDIMPKRLLPHLNRIMTRHGKALYYFRVNKGAYVPLLGAYGGKFAKPFAWYDHKSRCWRTWQRSLTEGWEQFSEAWPRSGMTRNGIAYQLPTLASLTSVIGSGLLPTIGKNEAKGSSRKRFKGSPYFRGAKMSEALRTGLDDPIYLHPGFAELAMGYPIGYTELKASEIQSRIKSQN